MTDFATLRRRMLNTQLIQRGISDQRVLDAMDRVPREAFVDEEYRDAAYDDRALPIQCGQTISQPYIVALMTEALRLEGPERVLEIGTGSGYQTAVLAELAREVVTVERHAELSASASRVLEELGYKNVRFVVGDGSQGYAALSPYDRIIVTAAAPQLPQPLVDQLAEGGILVVPVAADDGEELQAIRKVGGKLQSTFLSYCRFVPLVAEN